jgi:hypothetical protein
MVQQLFSPALVRVGQDVITEVGQELLRGGSLVRMQLVASRFYEAVKAELAATSPDDAHRLAALSAVVSQCSRLAQQGVSPHLIFVELRAAVAMLTRSMPDQPEAVVRSPTLRVIQGGRAA